MLWADDDSNLPINSFSAFVQLKSLERHLEKKPNMKKSCSKTIQEDFAKSYIVQVEQPDCLNRELAREQYLPHHHLLHPHKPGKVRHVHNGAENFHD